MDILVCIPREEEHYVRSTKLNPISGLDRGFWTLSGHPKFTERGDRIWFCIFGEVVASARIINPCDEWEDKPAVCFDIPTAMGHEFSVPHKLPLGFQVFYYVRRAKKRVAAKNTQALELVGATRAEELFPKNW